MLLVPLYPHHLSFFPSLEAMDDEYMNLADVVSEFPLRFSHRDELLQVLTRVFTVKREIHWELYGPNESFSLSSEYKDPSSECYYEFFRVFFVPLFSSFDRANLAWRSLSASQRFILLMAAVTLPPEIRSQQLWDISDAMEKSPYIFLQLCNEVRYLINTAMSDPHLSTSLKEQTQRVLTPSYDYLLNQLRISASPKKSCCEKVARCAASVAYASLSWCKIPYYGVKCLTRACCRRKTMEEAPLAEDLGTPLRIKTPDLSSEKNSRDYTVLRVQPSEKKEV